ncbi:MAG: P-loop NTPase [Chlamydiales bacterium]|nr:P-loop NTPase [Chlamydiales bacterium]
MPLPIFQKPQVLNRIGVAAGKGGVGKSTLTLQLALAFQRMEKRVGILDADLYGPSLRTMLKEVRLPFGNKPAFANGLHLISAAYLQPSSFIVRAPVANRLLDMFLTQVEWGDLDYLFIDFPPGTGDIPLTLAEKGNLTGVVLVTTPQEVALHDVARTYNFFEKVQIPILGVVENMSYLVENPSISPFGRGLGRRFAEERGLSFLGEVPLDAKISTFQDRGEGALVKTTAFEEIANRLQLLT